MARNVLILGAKGMLGQGLVTEFQSAGYAVTAWDRDELDVTDFAATGEKIMAARPDILLNATGYNAVDQCETDEAEYQKALLLNREVPKFLAGLAKRLSVVFVHYSTDYVFGGEDRPEEGYPEHAPPAPVSRYAVTKLMGEQEVVEAGGLFYLIRLCRLFGRPGSSPEAKQSFFAMMLEAGRSRESVQAVHDEASCFTYAPDAARATRELVESGDPYGVYHLPNEGSASWYEAVCELYRLAGVPTRVEPVDADRFPRPAKRPKFSTLRNTKRPRLRHYREALVEFLHDQAATRSVPR